MFFIFGRKRRESDIKAKEAEIAALKEKREKKAIEALDEAKKINTLISENPNDIALQIFLATGGYRRNK